MIVFKDNKIAEKAAMLRDHGMKKTKRYLLDPEFAFLEACKGQNYVIEQHSKSIILSKWDSLLESVIN